MPLDSASTLWQPTEGSPLEEWPITPAWSRAALRQLRLEVDSYQEGARRLGYRPQSGIDETVMAGFLIKHLRDEKTGPMVASDIALYLNGPRPFVWWGTPLGRACAWHIGSTEEIPPTEIITAVLGYSRQYLMRIRNRREVNGMPRDLSNQDLINELRTRWRVQRETGRLAEDSGLTAP